MMQFTKEELLGEFIKLIKENRISLANDSGPLARYARRVEAIEMVESNLALQELVADINDYHNEANRRSFVAIAKYLGEKHGLKMTWGDIWDIVLPEVFEDKECEGCLWMNGISNDMDNFHEGRGKNSFNSPLSMGIFPPSNMPTRTSGPFVSSNIASGFPISLLIFFKASMFSL